MKLRLTLALILDIIIISIFNISQYIFLNNYIIEYRDNSLKYTIFVVMLIYIIFLIFYFIIYLTKNKKVTFGQNILKIKIKNYKKTSLTKLILTNYSFYFAIFLLIISVLPNKNIQSISVSLIFLITIIYIIMDVLDIGLVDIFGSKIKYTRRDDE